MRNKALLAGGVAAGAIAILALILSLVVSEWDSGRSWWDRDYSDYGGYGMMSGYGMGSMMGGSMMGGYGGYGTGGMMGGYGMGSMMGGPADVSTPPLTLDQAADAARRYVDYWNNSDLKAKEVLEFTNDFYALVIEQSTGAGAFEIIIDRNTGVASPEMGPNMMWNTGYGTWGSYDDSGSQGYGPGGMMGGGMMGRYGRERAAATTDMPVKKDDARNRAQQFLDRQLPGGRAGEPDTFYGYYTIEIEKDGRILGMLSVNGYYGQVWYHTWHGAFLNEKKL